jgi:hypothetical protein
LRRDGLNESRPEAGLVTRKVNVGALVHHEGVFIHIRESA